MREAYALFGRRGDLTSNQDRLLGPEKIHLDASGEAVVFRVENQAVALWGVPVADLDKPDPPAVMKLSLVDKQTESWQAWLDTFSSACVEIVLSESLFSSDELGDNRAQEDCDTELLAQRYTRLPLPDYPTSQVAVPALRWFAGRDVVLRDDQQAWLWVRARTQAALDDARRDLAGFWEMDGDE